MRVDQLAKDYDIEVEWRSYLLDPTTPEEGRPHPYPPEARAQRQGPLQAMAAEAGLPLVDREWISNSRKALEAAEYAREQGLFDPFHRAVFHAYFAEGRDIGNRDELRAIARAVGLDDEALATALAEGRYTQRVEADVMLAWRIGFTGVPAFILGNRAIVGAQPYAVFEEVMTLLGRAKRSSHAGQEM